MYTPSQQAAIDAWDCFDGTTFALLGSAGTGKTFLTAHIIQRAYDKGLAIGLFTPTHKAKQVAQRFLASNGLPFYESQDGGGEGILTGTTAQALGIAPVLDDQGVDDPRLAKQKFKKAFDGLLEKQPLQLVIVDEISMVPMPSLKLLHSSCKAAAGRKLLVVGDPNQLPPVKAQPIDFGKIKNQAVLTDIVRQQADSPIVGTAYAMLNGRPWGEFANGRDVVASSSLLDDFLAVVQPPAELDEPERSVFLAYTNANVNAAQDAACRQVYGHSRREYRKGQLVIAERPIYGESYQDWRTGRWINPCLCVNQDELIVDYVDTDTEWAYGHPASLVNRRTGARIHCTYQPDEGGYRERMERELDALAEEAIAAKARGDDYARKAAWHDFFGLRDRTVLSFRHAFAQTTHKSQGSTYRRVFANMSDILRYSKAAAYVAATRPSEQLILG